jgi:hypothetical protein
MTFPFSPSFPVKWYETHNGLCQRGAFFGVCGNDVFGGEGKGMGEGRVLLMTYTYYE